MNFSFKGIGLTIVATVFLFFVYYFDWMIHGHHKFTVISEEIKTKCKSRTIPINERTVCGAQDLNTKIKIKLDDSYLVVDTTADDKNRILCLEPNVQLVAIEHTRSTNKTTRSIRLGDNYVILERPYGNARNVANYRMVS